MNISSRLTTSVQKTLLINTNINTRKLLKTIKLKLVLDISNFLDTDIY